MPGIIEAISLALQAYVTSVQIQERSLDWQMGVDKAEKEQWKARAIHAEQRLAIYEAANAKPGTGGSDSGKL